MNRVYQLQHDSSVTTNAAVYLTCPRKGKLKRVTWAVGIDCVADNCVWLAELSFASVGQMTVNDPIGPVAALSWASNIGAAGVGNVSLHETEERDIDILPGDRLHYNVAITGVLSAYVRILIEIDE